MSVAFQCVKQIPHSRYNLVTYRARNDHCQIAAQPKQISNIKTVAFQSLSWRFTVCNYGDVVWVQCLPSVKGFSLKGCHETLSDMFKFVQSETITCGVELPSLF